MIDGRLVDGGFVPELDRKPRLDIDTGNFTAKVDNFDLTNLTTYDQRYWYNRKYAKPDGPQFLRIEGETTAKANWIADDDLPLVSLAKEIGASLFLLEHRFYGESQPTGNLSVASLKYLTSQQALADIKNFILGMKANFNFTNPRWILFGGSYAGSLVAWARELYPNSVYGAVASSGPVQAVVDMSGYLEVVYHTLKNYDPECVSSVKHGMLRVNELIKNGLIGMTKINDLILDEYKQECADVNYTTLITWFKDVEIGKNSSNIISEMTDENVIPIDYFIKKCIDVFGDVFDNSTIYKNVDETNAIYKGQKGYNGKRVVFSNGSNDPWHVLSVLEPTNEQNYPILINGTSHCADLYPAKENDHPNLKRARELIRNHVISWVKNIDGKY
uniref:Serine carboxypeptidase n=1 Tax=Panagrolaimus sp. JU765 TaxID=591449 RepID=A0AC34R9N7_9BILA